MEVLRGLPKADRRWATAWWTAVVLRSLLPAAFAVTMGMLVGAVERDESLLTPLVVLGSVFVLRRSSIRS